MNLTYRTRRRLQRAGIIALVVLLVSILVWFCWVIWLERYVVYTRDGATLNFDLSDDVGTGQLAAPPSAGETVPIYVNEGSNAINTSTELTQFSGYYIDADTLQNDLSGVRDTIATLPAGTAVMVELKNIWGSFFYTSSLEDATLSTKVSTTDVDNLLTDITSRNLYAIAKIPAFRERYYFLIDNANTSAGFAQKGKGYLWADDEKCYWLDPTDRAAISWVTQIIEELKGLGFDEVVLSEFRIPNSSSITVDGDSTEIITQAAASIVSSCATESFAVSFLTSDSTFPLPEGRSRLYLENVSAKNVDAIVAQLGMTDPTINLVFMTNTNDTRYDEYSVLRPITMATSSGN